MSPARSLILIDNSLCYMYFLFAPFLGAYPNALKDGGSGTFQDTHTQTYPQNLWATS